jgi:hypothetical protein
MTIDDVQWDGFDNDAIIFSSLNRLAIKQLFIESWRLSISETTSPL